MWLLRASSGTTILRPQTQGNSGWSPGGLPLQGRKPTVITSFLFWVFFFFSGSGRDRQTDRATERDRDRENTDKV